MKKLSNIKIDNELVSIIIPTYKRPKMLERAISSCLKQTYQNIEILIIDDNNPNTDERKETELFMKKYDSNSKIRYIKRERNGGGSASRNTGIWEARGTYIAFLDDDDYYFEKKVETQIYFMKQNNLDVSFTGSETFDETKRIIIKSQTHKKFEDYNQILHYHLVEMIVSPQTFMYKTDVIKSVGGFDNVKAGQEYYLMYKTILGGYKIGCIHDILVRICIHSGERITTGKNKLKAEKDLYDLKKRHFNELKFKERRQIKYIYKYNVWKQYKSSNNWKQYLYFLYILLTHFIFIINRKVIK